MNLLAQLFSNPLAALSLILAYVLAITVHEAAHAYAAYRLGDDTPMEDGRVTLSPLAHLDPIGSLLFLAVGFGYGKPVRYDPRQLRGRRDELYVALAGPASNLLLAVALNLAVRLLPAGPAAQLLAQASLVNVFLAAFNMIPVPPLDGSAIIAAAYPPYRDINWSRFGLLAILALSFSGILGLVLRPLVFAFTFITSLGGAL